MISRGSSALSSTEAPAPAEPRKARVPSASTRTPWKNERPGGRGVRRRRRRAVRAVLRGLSGPAPCVRLRRANAVGLVEICDGRHGAVLSVVCGAVRCCASGERARDGTDGGGAVRDDGHLGG